MESAASAQPRLVAASIHARPSEAPPPLRERFLAVDAFLPAADAEAMRGRFEAHFAAPQQHRPETHQVWNYWHVPGLYTYLRTKPEKILTPDLVWNFHRRLTEWTRERLGMGYVSWPNLSLYVDGCEQRLHNDSKNGRFGFVYSLTPDSRRSRGGETILVREGDLFRDNLASAQAGAGLYELAEPRFNRLLIFDDRIPHGVQRVEGSMDPLDGRLVLHGHISENGAALEGPLSAEAAWATARPLVDAEVAAAEGPSRLHRGPLVVRLGIHPDGSVVRTDVLVDRVARSDGGPAGPLVDRIVRALTEARFPTAAEPAEATLPIMLGGALSGPEEGIVATRLAAPAQPARPAAERAPPLQVAAVPENSRAAQGAAVRARIAAHPKAKRLPKDRLEAYVVPDFLKPDECAALIARIDDACRPSGLLAPSPDPEFRTSDTAYLSRIDPLVAEIEARMDALTGLEAKLGEPVQGQRYAVGQQFKPHHDFFHTDQPYWAAQEATGGQRIWTAMIFLNVPEAGGQTQFPKAGLRITPAAGFLLLWNNLDPAGEPNHDSLHQGLPVEAGTKYIVTKWYRERPFGLRAG